MYRTGDIIMTRCGSLYGELIVYFMKLFQRDIVNYSHTLIVVDEDNVLNSDITSLFITDIVSFLSNCNKYKVLRYKYLTDDNKDEIYKLCQLLNGMRYSKRRIVLQLLDHVFFTNFFTKKFDSEIDHVCSSSVAWVYHEILGNKFNKVDWMSVEPDDIEDESLLNPDNWIIVKEK